MNTQQPSSNSQEHAKKFADTGHRAVDQMAEKLKATEDKLSHVSEDIKKQSEQSVKQVKGYIKEHPLASLGIAFAGGLFLAAILKR